MTNVLEDMKAVYKDEVVNVIEVDIFNSYFTLDSKDRCTYLDVPFHEVKPLLKFPYKDSEFWSCDLFVSDEMEDDDYVLVWHNGVRWLKRWILTCEDKFKVCPTQELPEEWVEGSMSKMKRLCSLYDKEALDHLPEDVVNKLKKETV